MVVTVILKPFIFLKSDSIFLYFCEFTGVVPEARAIAVRICPSLFRRAIDAVAVDVLVPSNPQVANIRFFASNLFGLS